jgi:hypothetical protein
MLETIKEYNLDKFKVKVEKALNDTNVVSLEVLDSLTTKLNNEVYPRGIVETLEVLDGVKRITVSDHDNNILIMSTNELLDINE